MATNDLIIGYVLDKSGSMIGLTPATVEGFNKFRQDQLNEDGETWMSLCLFNASFDVRYVAWNLRDIPEMSAFEGPNSYQAGGGTALYDAVGATIDGLAAWKTNNPWFEGKVLIAVWTDGEENMSREWSLDRLNKAIEERQKEGWVFMFLGAGQGSWLEAQKFTSIPVANVMYSSSSAAGVSASYKGASTATSTLRNYGEAAMTASIGDWNTENAPAGAPVTGANLAQDDSTTSSTSLAEKLSKGTSRTSGKPKK